MSYVPELTVEGGQALTINCPGWFARPDFQRWLNAGPQTPGGSQRATWHVPGQAPGCGSDTFLTYDGGDGSDFDGLFPPDLKEALDGICRFHGLDRGIIRLTNLDG